MLTKAQLCYCHVFHSRNTFLHFSSFSGKDLGWKLWSQIKVHALYSWEAAVLLCVQCQQTSAYLTPYKVVVKKENGEKHFTINLD